MGLKETYLKVTLLRHGMEEKKSKRKRGREEGDAVDEEKEAWRERAQCVRKLRRK